MLILTLSGQGTQWPQMGKQLIHNVSAFRNSIEGMDDLLSTRLYTVQVVKMPLGVQDIADVSGRTTHGEVVTQCMVALTILV